MAQKIQTLFIDDLDGGEAEGTVRFGLDGTDYEIDLSAPHAKALRKSLEKYVGAARKVSALIAAEVTVAGGGMRRAGRARQKFVSGPRPRG